MSSGCSTITPALSRCCWATLRPGDAPHAAGLGHQPAEAVVGLERIAAGGDEIEDFLERLLLEAGVRRGRADFGEQLVLLERRGDRHRQDVLGEHVERAGAEDFGIELAVVDRVQRGAGFEIFEAVAGDDDALARLVEPVVGAADPLQQPRAALGRAHLDDEVDVAPVDAEVEAGGRDQPAQLARGHRRFDLAPRLDREAAVMDADRQALSLPSHKSWKISSARPRVLQKTSVVLCCSISRITSRDGVAARMARPTGSCSRGSGSTGRARRRDRR